MRPLCTGTVQEPIWLQVIQALSSGHILHQHRRECIIDVCLVSDRHVFRSHRRECVGDLRRVSRGQDLFARECCVPVCARKLFTRPEHTTCASCGPGATSSGTDGVDSCACDIGFYWTEASSDPPCVACPAGTYNPSVNIILVSNCLTCPEGTTSSSGQSTCMLCAAGYTDTPCSPCAAGSYKSTIGPGECLPCPAVIYKSDSGPGECSCVPDRYTSTTGPGECLPCPAGSYKSDSGPGECNSCPTGRYSSASAATTFDTCVLCPEFSTSPLGSSSKTACECDPGYTDVNGGVCEECLNSWSSTYGSATCTKCPSGMYTVRPTVVSSATCVACPAGKISAAPAAGCINAPCDAGYMGNPGQCSACLPGTYKNVTGSENCVWCPVGKVRAQPAVSCIDGPCGAGYTGLSGACIACIAGKYKSETGSDICLWCLENTYSPAGVTVCLSCPAGTVSAGTPRAARYAAQDTLATQARASRV